MAKGQMECNYAARLSSCHTIGEKKLSRHGRQLQSIVEELLLSIQEHEGPLPSAAVQINVAADGDDDRHGNASYLRCGSGSVRVGPAWEQDGDD